ncbi:hypothetical protein [Methylocaldum szegediense]|uniref:Uncharacterized protein n=1 Tax=Methylocaldum szegediense TaxID=73780 RepID=A0ABM9I1G2_9GAMM|nr:hypothetical protein [Methylocaldum szegediense]CAI8826157.1 conserved protein of unknown function [Methylocaldum szegediense]
MHDVQKGFRIGDQFVSWGTTLAEACRLLGIEPDHKRGKASLPCANTYGFAVVSAELDAPATDRPVMTVTFELAPYRTGTPEPEIWATPLSERLGPPDKVSRSEISSDIPPGNAVQFNAHWTSSETDIGLSVYGGLRKVDDGFSVGRLSLSWSTRLAARPYIDEWRARVKRLVTIAERLSALWTFKLDWPHSGYWMFRGHSPEALAEREARISLYEPELLDTPASIAAKLDPQSFAIWRSDDHGIWGASTLWDSVMVEFGQPTKVTWVEIKPAKGGGWAELQVGPKGDGPWHVQSHHGSPAIRNAAQMLAKFPGVRLEQQEGYDC